MDLELKFDNYLSRMKKCQDMDGFIMTESCDSLLFSCLIGCVTGVFVNPDAARGIPGQWFRRPLKTLRLGYPECYECGGSKSTISRDMLLGLAWYAWCNKDLDISEGVIKYALKNFGIMGKGVLSRTFIGPGLLGTFAWISYALGGPSRVWLRKLPIGSSNDLRMVGYEAHLQVLHYHLRGQVTGRESDIRLAERVGGFHAERCRGLNAYFNFVAGDRSSDILELDNLFPNYRLPNAHDRAEPWLWQRDPNGSWWPHDTAFHEHTGGDFIWAAAWYLGKIRK